MIKTLRMGKMHGTVDLALFSLKVANNGSYPFCDFCLCVTFVLHLCDLDPNYSSLEARATAAVHAVNLLNRILKQRTTSQPNLSISI